MAALCRRRIPDPPRDPGLARSRRRGRGRRGLDPAVDQGLQLAILVATFAAAEGFWYAAYALGGRHLARHLARPALRRLFDRATGAIFVGFGLGLLAGRP
ncbi:LysE family transporter [Methylobacterium sp. WL120]|uniref:LysE family translocator n=1 Tax=Methylobacterium sp. WL120 TaxID=2603887 RepID=UPI001FEF47A8|nr:LysE family transporter [Methylobacterium sp. WL120]